MMAFSVAGFTLNEPPNDPVASLMPQYMGGATRTSLPLVRSWRAASFIAAVAL